MSLNDLFTRNNNDFSDLVIKKGATVDKSQIIGAVVTMAIIGGLGYAWHTWGGEHPQGMEQAQATPVDAPATPLKAIDRYYEGMNSGEIGKCLGDFCSHQDKIAKGMCVLGSQEMAKTVKNEQDIEDTERMHDPMGMTGPERNETKAKLKESLLPKPLPKVVDLSKGGF